ncbi:MAG: 2,3-bisphosphoglycerate-independent phosphoglycerate mutase [Bacteroidales bacterium]|jgi:2,3-bisphosphoglycerate-independent phosphoglycerate mutase|nr:2,3-bisphosphoglycerate-independent phosphoglycerate mutase [Bacteroidales bacterium]
MDKKVLLMILDGWGIGNSDKTNAIYMAGQPNIDALKAKYPNSQLLACGENVGLPDGQMGNSEVGHMNIGAGRIVYQDLVKINKACKEHRLLENNEIKAFYDHTKKSGGALHFMGLFSNGGVHSSIDHLFAFLDTAKEYGLEKVFIHCFMDGRDTDPKSGKGFIKQLEEHTRKSTGRIASVVGRFYAMDRDKRWDRIKEAYDLLVSGKGRKAMDAAEAVEESYREGITDEFIKPITIVNKEGQSEGTIKEGDTVVFFNFRNDRARELTEVLTQHDMPDYDMKTLPLYYCCLTPYDDKFTGVHILFDKENIRETLGETVAKAGKHQLRIAETEKYAHVTFFFSGGREKPFQNEDRILVHSPKVATYDLQPEMSAPEVARKLTEALDSQNEDMVILNFANGDMVGHTGIFSAIEKAVKTIDGLVKEVVECARRNGYTVLITADHGNADHAINDDGTPNTAHSLNPVPFIVVDDDIKNVKNGILADIAPTILKLMGIQQPAAMTGKSLID